MRSERPKPLHRLCGRPMVLHVLDAMAEIDVRRVSWWLDTGPSGSRRRWSSTRRRRCGSSSSSSSTQPGTGDALAVGLTGLPDDDDEAEDVVVLPGDTPLLRPRPWPRSSDAPREDAGATLLTAEVANPHGYGRVVHGKDGSVSRVVEEADATEDEQQINEVNTSIYCFRRSILAPTLRRLSPANAQGEYYLTDAIAVLSTAGYTVRSLVLDDPMEAAGVNDRAQLAVAEAELRDRINERWMRRGVTMWDPERTYVDAQVAPGSRRLAPSRSGSSRRLHHRVRERARARLHPYRHRRRSAGRWSGRACAPGRPSVPEPRIGPFSVLEPGAEVPPGAEVAPHSIVRGPDG